MINSSCLYLSSDSIHPRMTSQDSRDVLIHSMDSLTSSNGSLGSKLDTSFYDHLLDSSTSCDDQLLEGEIILLRSPSNVKSNPHLLSIDFRSLLTIPRIDDYFIVEKLIRHFLPDPFIMKTYDHTSLPIIHV